MLAVGGCAGLPCFASVERYDPAAGTWSAFAPLSTPRSGHAASLLPDGSVLVVGGYDGAGYLASAEIY